MRTAPRCCRPPRRVAALRQARDHATAAGDRVAAELERLEAEARDLQGEIDRARMARTPPPPGSSTDARAGHDRLVAERSEAEARLAELRTRRAERTESDRAPANEAWRRPKDAAAFARRARGQPRHVRRRGAISPVGRGRVVRRRGAVADHLVVERSFERAVDALLGELLQHVLVDRAGGRRTRRSTLLAGTNAGRCGFLVLAEAHGAAPAVSAARRSAGARALASVVRATGPHAKAVLRVLPGALIVDSFDAARDAVAQSFRCRSRRSPARSFNGALARRRGIAVRTSAAFSKPAQRCSSLRDESHGHERGSRTSVGRARRHRRRASRRSSAASQPRSTSSTPREDHRRLGGRRRAGH